MSQVQKCVFLDRDGVLNYDRPDYAYQLDHFKIIPGVAESLKKLKAAGYLLIVVTNQSGIAQGIYTQQDMENCHAYFQAETGNLVDHFYFSPYHPTKTASLGRKPGSLLFEKAIAKYAIEPTVSWMVGDRGRDLIPARKLGIRTIQVGNEVEPENKGDFEASDLVAATQIILSS